LFTGTLFILLVALVLWLWLLAIPEEEAVVDEVEERVEIAITADGFEPATVLIPAGTEVTWINQNIEPHWIASNPHPDHDELPGLNSNEAIGPEGSYSYTFEESGEYGYHDHLNPETNGVVIVE
jgi:plastocyanin